MIIAPGPSSVELGKEIAKILKAKIVPMEFKTFPDGEGYIRFKGRLKNKHVVIVQSTINDKNMLQLLFMARTAKDLGANTVTAVVPYFGYARQDKRFKSGEVVSSKIIIELMEESGIDRLITLDIHSKKLLKHFKIKAVSLSAMPAIGKYFLKFMPKCSLVLGPDEGALEKAKVVAEVLGTDHDYLVKHRDRTTGEVKTRLRKRLDVRGRDIVIVDDIISSGGTVINVINILKKMGARSAYVGCTHPVLAQGSLKKILKAGAMFVVGTNSIETKISKISMAPIIAKELKTYSELLPTKQSLEGAS